MKVFRSKKAVAVLVAGAIALGGAGAALAYFTSSGTGTGNATVGTSSNWSVASTAPTGGALLPGTGTDTVAYTVTNSGSGYQELNGTTAALTTDVGGGVYDTTTDRVRRRMPGLVVSQSTTPRCLATWRAAATSPAA